jgi:hypothetical protein
MSHWDFPDCCSKCLTAGPAQVWKISASEYKPGAGNSTVVITYSTHVPVCDRCYRGLSGMSWLSWIVACMIAGLAIGAIVIYAPKVNQHLDTFPPIINVGALVLIGGLIVWGSGWFLNTLLVDSSVGSFDPTEQTIHFTNREYQAKFDAMNRHQVEDHSWMQV